MFVFVPQLWQEICEENQQVQDIMSTLENFQLDTTPAKPRNHDDCEIRPVHVEQRYGSNLHTYQYHFPVLSSSLNQCSLFKTSFHYF